uniref:Kinetochore localized astrin (SPAG5) binding protein n=1 Tax=Oncorhynchus tshawytscha TaxID=74940 RepID=A0A8C8IWQ6_ONCTS
MASKIPRCGQSVRPAGSAAEMKRAANKYVFKETAVPSDFNFFPKTAIFKPLNENVPRPTTRYGQQSELKSHNQLLLEANEELQKNLTETQQKVAQLEQRCSDLQGTNADVQKQLKDCHVLLVAGNIDPVLGEKIGKTAQQNEDQQREVVNVSQDLLRELQTFGDMATEQSAQLTEVQKTMKALTDSREHLVQERENFSLEVEEMDKALEEAEQLLLE